MKHPVELIDELVRQHLKPALRELGFKSKGLVFFRQTVDLTEIVSLQKSRGNDSVEANFTINLGVFWPTVHQTLGRPSASSPPKEYDCSLRQRLGPLFDNGKDFWWRVSSNSDIDQIGAEVVTKIKAYALPWLDRATRLDEAARMANPCEAAVLYVLKGEREHAKELLEKSLDKNKHANAFVRSVAQKLGLEISADV